MKLILQEKGERFAVLTVPDNTNVMEKVFYQHGCLNCQKMHEAEFKHVGVHDDGEIYELVGVHQ